MHTAKQERLEQILREHAPLVVAYSGGVDSAYLLAVATRVLGDSVTGVIADSPSLPRRALEAARELGRQIGARVEVIETTELDDPNYAANPMNRCYFCKAELFSRLDVLARARGFRAVAYGENADDAFTVRPGAVAAGEFSVIAPLREAGLSKPEIRELSRALDLPTADAPAQPCLSSRIPHGTPVSRDALGMIERAEDALRDLGFVEFRVRHIAPATELPTARVQISLRELERAKAQEDEICESIRRCGYFAVELDPDGYRPPERLAPDAVKAALDKLGASV
jgi:uncharacterized protein